MTSVAAWFRLDLRRRWRSMLVLALLVAFAAGTVMTAVAGAQRGATALDRLLAETQPATVAALPNQRGFDWDAVRARPEVEALSTFILGAGYELEGRPAGENGDFPYDAEAMHSLERPVVLKGRLADLTRADEVVVTPAFVENSGKGVGDTVTLRLYQPETADIAAFGSADVRADGPEVVATIVGVIRSAWFGDDFDDAGRVVPSAGLASQYRANLVGAEGTAEFNALVRLRGGEADMAAFKAGLERVSGRSDIDFIDMPALVRRWREVTGFEADALLAFAVAAGLAAIFLVGQAVARYSASTVADLQVLRAAGMTSGQSGWAAAAGPALAALAGSALGVASAIVASRWFPMGSASLVEPAPGLDVDVPVLVVGGVAVPVLVAAGAVAAAWLALRSGRSDRTPHRSAVAAAATRVGAPVSVVIGARFALEPGRGRQAVPVRPALLGSVVGVLGVLAAFTFSDGVDDAAANPARFGQVHQLEGFLGFNGDDYGPVEEILPVLAADPDVLAVNDVRVSVGEVANVPVTLFTLDPVAAPWEPVVTDGRVPEGPDEVALAPGSAEAIGVSVGDIVAMNGTRGTRELTVSGIAFVPEASHNDYVTGGWVTRSGFDALVDPEHDVSPAFKYHLVHVALRPGADPQAVAARIETAAAPIVATALTAAGRDPGEVSVEGFLTPPWPPSTLQEVQQVRALPVFLAGFLALLALGAVGHALATAVRRRRHDVAVLRALGMTRTQSRGVVVTQASVLALVGLVVGVPLGLALGRTIWRYVADTTPLYYVPPRALLALLLIAPAALLAANLLAAWPARRAASMRVGHVLRAE